MSLPDLRDMIREARRLAVGPCDAGAHAWEPEGGRGCPYDRCTDDTCGQSVYRCAVCGTYDHGEPGGPGWSDCEQECRHRPTQEPQP